MKLSKSMMTTLILALAALPACGGKSEPTPPPEAKAPAVEKPPAIDDAAIVDAYDALRAALADDDLALTKSKAKALADVSAPLPAVAKPAAALGADPDLEAARLTFGTVSKGLIGRLAAEPSAAEGLYAYLCPMAKGYQKWVQKAEAMDNPYMGQRMLKCGGPTELVP